jgi:hypothetical protein
MEEQNIINSIVNHYINTQNEGDLKANKEEAKYIRNSNHYQKKVANIRYSKHQEANNGNILKMKERMMRKKEITQKK